VATGIGHINKDGSSYEVPDRWGLRANSGQGLSLYKVFKAMFFRTESDYRLITCIISAEEIETTRQRITVASPQIHVVCLSFSI
jgi:hypothetical protein